MEEFEGIRDFIGDHIHIDGRMIGYRIETAHDYFRAQGMNEKEMEDFIEEHHEIKKLVNQIIAVKHSCWLLRRTSYSCQSLSDDMYDLKEKLILELKNKYNYEFDDDLMEKYCGSQS